MTYRAGFITLVGRPNVGKSTLLNRLVGKKVSITSPKPQTTRHRLLGIRSSEDYQMIFVDTPGIHAGGKRYINQVLNRTAANAMLGVDIILLMISAEGWQPEDHMALQAASREHRPLLLLINKIDRLRDRTALLPLLEESSRLHDFQEMIPLSATKGDNVDALVETLVSYLPASPQLFPEDQLTDRGDRFIVSETVREKLFRQLHREIPYALAVEVRQFEKRPHLVRIDAIIWVEKATQKGIIIGKGGEKLRAVGSSARHDLEAYFACKVFLQLWVKVRENWADDRHMLRSIGYLEQE